MPNPFYDHLNAVLDSAEKRSPALRNWERDFDEAITGESSAFWDAGCLEYDNEQEFRLVEWLRAACRMPGATPAERWARLERGLREEAAKFASIMADERGDSDWRIDARNEMGEGYDDFR